MSLDISGTLSGFKHKIKIFFFVSRLPGRFLLQNPFKIISSSTQYRELGKRGFGMLHIAEVKPLIGNHKTYTDTLPVSPVPGITYQVPNDPAEIAEFLEEFPECRSET